MTFIKNHSVSSFPIIFFRRGAVRAFRKSWFSCGDPYGARGRPWTECRDWGGISEWADDDKFFRMWTHGLVLKTCKSKAASTLGFTRWPISISLDPTFHHYHLLSLSLLPQHHHLVRTTSPPPPQHPDRLDHHDNMMMMKGTCENLGEKIHSVRCSNCRNSLGFKVIILLMMMVMVIMMVSTSGW